MSIDTENSSPRLSIAALFLSAFAFVGIALDEGYTDKAIIPVPGDDPTMGFGTKDGVKLGDRTTPPKALVRALSDVEKFEGALKKCIKVPLHPHEYDAYVNLSYNIGAGAFCGSTLVKKLNASDYTGACNAILNWRYYQGNDCSLPANKSLCGGLWARRQKTTVQCLGLGGAQ